MLTQRFRRALSRVQRGVPSVPIVFPGDTIMLRHPGVLDKSQAAKLVEAWRKASPHVRAIWLHSGTTVEAVIAGTTDAETTPKGNDVQQR